MSDQPRIMLPEMCQKHQYLLVQQTGYGPKSPWRALVVMAQVALFQGVSADPKVTAASKGDITHLSRIGCHACLRPDLFGEIVEAAKVDLGAIKDLGEKWVQAGTKP